jgi:ABC-type branched-subunit amino acid transport system ATPase component
MSDLSTPILEARNIVKRFGGVTAVSDVSLTVAKAEILGLIGPNGSGKSTMVNLITGEMFADSGAFAFNGRDITTARSHQRAYAGMARTFQLLRLFRSLSVEDNIVLARYMRMKTSVLDTFLGRHAARGNCCRGSISKNSRAAPSPRSPSASSAWWSWLAASSASRACLCSTSRRRACRRPMSTS